MSVYIDNCILLKNLGKFMKSYVFFEENGVIDILKQNSQEHNKATMYYGEVKGREFIINFFSALNFNSYLTTLQIHSYHIPKIELIALFNGLKENKTILSFSLVSYGLTAESAEALTNALTHNNTLFDFSIIAKSDMPKHFNILCQGLKNNHSIESLNLSCNYLNDSNISILVDTLLTKGNISTLNLSDNVFQSGGTKEIIKLLKNCPSLVDLKINNTLISINDADNIITASLDRPSLTSFNIECTDSDLMPPITHRDFYLHHCNLLECNSKSSSTRTFLAARNATIDKALHKWKKHKQNNHASPTKASDFTQNELLTLYEYRLACKWKLFKDEQFELSRSFLSELSKLSAKALIPQFMEIYCCASEMPSELIAKIVDCIIYTNPMPIIEKRRVA